MTAVSNCASINTFTDETWLCGRLAGCVTLSPAHNDDEDDDDDTEDADGDGGPVRDHQVALLSKILNVLDLSVLHSYLHQINNKTL